MSEFSKRFDSEFSRKVPEILSVMQESASVSTVTPEEFQASVKALENLLQSIKDEVYELQHSQPSEDQKKKPKDKKKEEQPDGLEEEEYEKPIDELTLPEIHSKILELVEKMRKFIDGGLDLDPGSSVVYYMFPFFKTMGKALKQMVDFLPVIWAISQVIDESDRLINRSISSSKDEINSSILNSESEIIRSAEAESIEIQRQLGQLATAIDECCGAMHQDQETALNDLDIIKSLINQLDPATQSNNVLEVLQRQKAIQAALTKIRGLL